MESRAERNLFRRRLGILVALAVALFLFQAFLMGSAKQEPMPPQPWISWQLWRQVLAAIIPNFIAGLVAAIAVFLFMRVDEMTHYVRAMRSLRSAVGASSKLSPDDVQSLMQRFVPAISELYFEADQPPIRNAKQIVDYPKRTCFSCKQASPVKAGRCTICRDVLASWQVEELPQQKPV